ncbi:MAG: TM2 domain-containing protein [Bacteroidales bacterium]|nr:TM2 domain-containing protein [Bacteroidales bacterium]
MKSKGAAYLLLLFFGVLGIHKFYLGKVGMGILYLLTLGFLGIGCLIDLFTLGSQVDTYNALFMARSAAHSAMKGQNSSVTVNLMSPSSSSAVPSSPSEVDAGSSKEVTA